MTDNLVIRLENFNITLSNQKVYSSHMNLQKYVECFMNKHPDDKYRKEIKITKVGFIHMETGPHIQIDPRDFFGIPRIDYRNFMELKQSGFTADMCMSDEVMIIRKYHVFYHFDIRIDTSVKLINWNIGGERRKMNDDREVRELDYERKRARIVECDNDNDHEDERSLVRSGMSRTRY